MAIKLEVSVEPWRDLEYVNGVVKDYEESCGPLIDIGSDSKVTKLAFKVGQKPENHAIIIEHPAHDPKNFEDGSFIDDGSIFVSGKLVLCLAYRPEG